MHQKAFSVVLEYVALRDSVIALRNKYSIPGLSIAVWYKERLAYCEAFGYSDLETRKLMHPDSLFRIASISKQITEVAIRLLAQSHSLRLDDTVFGNNGVLGNDYGRPPHNSKIDTITIRNLLDHKSGWTNIPNDPMFIDPEISQQSIIGMMVTKRPLSANPGGEFYYLNLGYCVLGRVIEKVTRMPYADHVQEAVLKPSGIADMKIGGNTLSESLESEVHYYQQEYSPYIINVARMDSHGGWVGSALDLIRFMLRVDGRPNIPDLLNEQSISNTHFTFPAWYFTGSLPGTSALVARLNDDINYVFLANTRTERNPNEILDDIYNTINQQLLSIKKWSLDSNINL